MQINKKYLLNILLIVSITAVAMYFALRDHFKDIVHAISTMNPFWLLVIVAWGMGVAVVTGIGYMILGRFYRKDYSLKEGVIVSFVGTFFAGITPSSTGGQFGQIYVLKKQGIDYSDGASLLWADFIIYQTTMMIFVTILFVLRFGHYVNVSAWFWIVAAGYVVNAIVIIGLYTIALFPKLYIWLSGKIPYWLAKIHIVKDPDQVKEHWIAQVTRFTSQSTQLTKNWKVILQCSGANFLRLLMYFSLPAVVSMALGIRMNFSDLVDSIALASFVTMANCFVPLPGSTGGTEVFFTMLFQTMLGKLTGAVLLLWRVASYYLPVLAGALVFLLFKGRQDRLENRAKLDQARMDTKNNES